MKTNTKKRSKIVTALLLPAIIFLWIVGWSLYWIGHNKKTKVFHPVVGDTCATELLIAEELVEA